MWQTKTYHLTIKGAITCQHIVTNAIMVIKNVRLESAPTLRYSGDMVIQYACCVAEVANFPRKYLFAEGSSADIQTKKRVKHDKL